MKPIPSSASILATLLVIARPPRQASAQTAVGCSATCPPVGYESDSSHLCPGDVLDDASARRGHAICHPTTNSNNNKAIDLDSSFKRPGYVTVIANYYTGCEAGRRESGVYAGMAQAIHDDTSGKVNFISSLKGGGDCGMWASMYQDDAVRLGLNGGIRPGTMPLTVEDGSLELRDRFFTPPFPHPSYIVLDENLEVTYKSVGPCCGYVSYYDCTDDVALGLQDTLGAHIYEVYNRQMSNIGSDSTAMTEPTIGATTPATTTTTTTTISPSAGSDNGNSSNNLFENDAGVCQATAYSNYWSACSKTCGDGGIQFRFRANSDRAVETRPCPYALPPCTEQCVADFGNAGNNNNNKSNNNGIQTTVIASDLDSPRDLAFHPTPGIHLGAYSEGRTFHPDHGEELWVVNGNNHSVSIIASLGTEYQTTISRLDRGYYHYMNNITALAFNTVKDSNRNADQDTFNYFAVCNDNRNDYIGSKEPNYFMGPTLYDTDTVNKPGKKNTVTRIGDDCTVNPSDECFFLHADMLHESPACIGIAHDPEAETAYGAVYWAFDATGDNSGGAGQLVKFDFSQPHGPGSMDHSIAQVRRYPEVKLYRDDESSSSNNDGSRHHQHAGMVVHPEKRVLFVANPGRGTIVAVRVDTGRYSRTAREEYPIFSNRLPSFEYSIYECVEQDEEFVSGLNKPSGLALSLDGSRLFVAERGGRILAVEVDSGEVLQSIDVGSLGYTSIGGLTISPSTGALYFVDMDANQVVRVDSVLSSFGGVGCVYQSRANPNFQLDLDNARAQVESECGQGAFSLARDYSCEVDGTIPNGTLFEQVHTDTGYASDNPDVQSMAGMDEAAALLANRTDCEYDSDLNFDALLLGGYYCHVCLPRNHGSSCDAGGTCANVQWQGFTCDNEFHVDYEDSRNNPLLVISSLHYDKTYPENSKLELMRGVTYRFTVRTGAGRPVTISALPEFQMASMAESSIKTLSAGDVGEVVTSGPILVTVDDSTPACLYLTSPRTKSITLMVEGANECQGSSGSVNSDVPGNTNNDGTSDWEWDLKPGQNPSSAHSLMRTSIVGCSVLVGLVTVSWASL